MITTYRRYTLLFCCLALAIGSSACSHDEVNGTGIDWDNDTEVDAGKDTGSTDTGTAHDAGDHSDTGDNELDAGDADTDHGSTDTGDTDVGADTGGSDTGDTDTGGADTGADTGVDTGTDVDTGGFDTGGDADTGTDVGWDTDAGGADVGGDTDVGYDTGDDPPMGLSEPCENGSGWTVFRFRYSNLSTSAQIQVWDASCDYSFAPNSACNVREVTQGMGDINRTSEGFPIATSSNYIRVRYSVEDLQFDSAEVHLQARSVSTSASTNYELWSPIYGSVFGGPVSVGFDTEWHTADWSNHLSPTDEPAMTAIQIYAQGGSNQLAIESVELCVDP